MPSRASPKCRASVAAFSEQSPAAGQSSVSTAGHDCLRWMEASVSGVGHHRFVESLLHDSPVSCVLWACCTVAVACLGAWQCVAFEAYQPWLRKARWWLRQHPDVMLLADRGFAHHPMMRWLQASSWHDCLRLPCDVLLHGASRYPSLVGQIYPPLGEARLYRHVRLWADGGDRCNLVLSTVQGAKESWVVATDETPLLQTLWHDALRFRVEDLFLDSKSGAFELEESRLRCEAALERLYWVAALALLYATAQGMSVQIDGLRQQVDPHWRRGISYLKLGLRWLQGVVHKGRQLLYPIP